jgi:glyceraldehyde-3-phosphate dehydrogenase (NADP+)
MAVSLQHDIFDGFRSDEGEYRYLRDGEWHRAASGRTIAITSPTDGAPVGRVQALSREEIDELFARAAAAQPAWEETPVERRATILHRAADLLEDNADTLAGVLVREIAKNRKDSRDEVVRSADFIRHTAEEGKRLAGEAVNADSFPGFKRNKIGLVHRVSLGVVLAIPPFNYPVNLAVSKIAPGLITGNSVVLKPPTQGSIAAGHLAPIFHAAGIPQGVFQVATGRGSEIGDYLVTHPQVKMITFTGSTETGQRLAKQSGMIPLLLELGGKDAAIVLSDADLDRAAADIVAGAFAYSGQRCTAVKRVLVTQPVADALAELVAERTKRLSVGKPEDNSDVTPLIDHASADYVQGLIDDAVTRGAEVLTGNKREANLLWPTVLDRVGEEMRVAWEEPFGPVLPFLRVANAAEAVRLANASEYGLQSSIFTRDLDAAIQIAAKLEVGTVQVNGKTARGPDHFPFLGTKSSGMGSQGIRYSLEAMTRLKSVVFNLADHDLENRT